MSEDIVVQHITGKDNWGKPVTVAYSLKGRLELKRREVLAETGETRVYQGSVYLLDTADGKVVEGDLIQAGARTWTAKSVAPVRDKSGILRHLEVMI